MTVITLTHAQIQISPLNARQKKRTAEAVAAHDKIAELAGADDAELRSGWSPTPAFLGLLPKLRRLELAQPFVDPEAFRTWHKQDDRTVTGACAGALELQAGWVHPLLSFNVPAAAEGRARWRDPVEGPEDEEDPSVNDRALEAEAAA